MFSFFKRKKNNQVLQNEQVPETEQNSEQSIDLKNINPQAEETKTELDKITNEINIDQIDAKEQPVSEIISELVRENPEPSAIELPQSEIKQDISEIETSSESLDTKQEESTPNLPPVVTDANIASIEENTDKVIKVEEKLSWSQRLKHGLSKSRSKLGKSLASLFGGGQIDEELYEDLEAVLLGSDMGLEATEYLLKKVRQRVSLKGLKDPAELKNTLEEALLELIQPLEKPLEIDHPDEPFVIMMVGVNGAGKTTSIGKLTKYFQNKGKAILMAAGDTFRAAAREQLMEWGERNNVTVVSQANGDSAAVCFDAVEAGKARKMDIVLADTAGRLPTQLHLMEEIKKVKRVIEKAQSSAPHEIILVLDANIGQNAINQVIAFDDALGLTGLILTKLDGTAKGGVIAALAKSRPIPVRFIGVGEQIDDLRPFIAKDYVDALLND